jgi:hypothetical protein
MSAANAAVRTVETTIISFFVGDTNQWLWMPSTYDAAGPTTESMNVKLKATHVRKTNVSEKFTRNPRNGCSVRETQT